MTIKLLQLKEIIIKPACNAIGLLSDAAVNLLLGTAAQETQLGTYIVQENMTSYDAGGIGIYQLQANSYIYIWNRHVETSPAMKAKIKLYLGYEGRPNPIRLASDLSLATIMARLFYANVIERLPLVTDIPGMAKYWKIHFNTAMGSGTEQQFINNYKKYILGES